MRHQTLASLSLDLDNLWAYMRIHGEDKWQAFPSYLDVVVPRFLGFVDARSLTMTVFVVGKDATIEANHRTLAAIAAAGHEIGNHSFMHEPWLHRYSADDIDAEITASHDAITHATGRTPRGFRGPGFSVTPAVLDALTRHGYDYDTTTLPTFIGPLARWYYFRGADLTDEQATERNALFGSFRDGWLPNKPYTWRVGDRTLDELPVTTFPVLKVPFHFSYLLYLSGMSERAADLYFRAGIAACRRLGIGPTMLLHPLDFLDATDAPEVGFFPAMDIPAATKMRRLGRYVDRLTSAFDVVPVGTQAESVAEMGRTRSLA